MPFSPIPRQVKKFARRASGVTAGAPPTPIGSLEPRRLMSIGDVDLAYGDDGVARADALDYSGLASAVHALPDGRAYAVSWGLGDFGLARLTVDGDLDPTFGDGGRVRLDVSGTASDQAEAIAVQPDGKVIVAGFGFGDFALVRVHADGRPDDTFGNGGIVRTSYADFRRPAGSFQLHGVLLQSDGKLLAYGTDVTGRNAAFARYQPDGSLDPTFGRDGTNVIDLSAVVGSADPYDRVRDAVALPGGGYVFAGLADQRAALVKLDAAGQLDASFSGDGVAVAQDLGEASSIAAAPGGGYYVVAMGGRDYGASLTRWDEQGQVDRSFGDGGLAFLTAGAYLGSDVQLQPDGTVLASHGFFRHMLPNKGRGFEWAVFSPAGQKLGGAEWGDPQNDAGGGGGLALQPDGRALFVGGWSRAVPGPLLLRFRTMPDAPKGARLDGNIIYVTGDEQANTLVVSKDAGDWRVVLDGVLHTFPGAAAARVDARLLGGDDAVTVAEGAPAGVVDLGAGNDTAHLADVAKRVFGGDGDDTFTFAAAPGGRRAPDLEPGAGDDVAVFDGGPAAESFTLRNGAVDAPGWTVSLDDAMERVRINAGGGDDEVTLDYVGSDPFGGPPPAGPAALLDGGAGNDTFTTRRGPVSKLQSFLGGEGDDRLVADDARNTSLSFTGGPGDDRVTVGRLVGTVTVSDAGVSSSSGLSVSLPDPASLEAIALEGSDAQGPDKFVVTRTAPGVPTAVSGGAGNDTFEYAGDLANLSRFTFDGGGQPGDEVVLTETAPGSHSYAVGAGTVTRGGAATVRFSNVKALSLNLNNGDGNRVVVNDAVALATLSVTGGSGPDTLEVPGPAGGLGAAPGAVVRLAGGPAGSPSGRDTFRLRPDPVARFVVFGDRPFNPPPVKAYDPNDPGDRLEVDPGGTTDPRLTVTGRGSGRYAFADRAAVDYYDVESLNEPVAAGSGATGVPPGLPHVLRFAFAADVDATLADGDLRLTNLTTGEAIPTGNWVHTYDRATNLATFTFPGFPGGRLPAGLYRATLPAGSIGTPGGATAADVSVEFGVAPSVAGVWVDGTQWTAAFRQKLGEAGLAGATSGLGVRLDPATVLNELPWSNANVVRVRFDGPVAVDAGDLAARGLNLAGYGIKSFAYDPGTRTATWTLSRALRNDRVQLDLNGGSGGVRLDGTTTSTPLLMDGDYAGAFPTGNGVPGGNFRLSLLPLPGDVNRDGRVNATDVLHVRSRLQGGTGVSAGRYSVFCDLNGDGRIDAWDLATVRAHYGRSLPAAPTATVAAATATAAGPSVASSVVGARRPYAPPRAVLNAPAD